MRSAKINIPVALMLSVLFFGNPAMAQEEAISFPSEKLFKPLIAYYKEPKFYISYLRYHISEPIKDNTGVGSVGYGEIFGLYEKINKKEGKGMQIGFGGGVFAQFNLETPSDNLVNADYTVGFPIMVRDHDFSFRFSLYHQSSHLGDEFLLSSPNQQRVNLSYYAVQLIAAYDLNSWRPYFGGEYLLHKDPADLDPNMLHAGIEYYGSRPIFSIGRFVTGVHLMSMEEHGWNIDVNIKAGIQFKRSGSSKGISVMFEGYRGFSPHGQFYDYKIRYFGLGIYFGV